MSENGAELSDRYHAAVGNLFEEVMHDPEFDKDGKFHQAAVAAQTALGKVQLRSDYQPTATNSRDKKIFSDELEKSKLEFDDSVIAFLRACTESVTVDTAEAGLELLRALPSTLSKKHDLSDVKARLDRIILKSKKP